MDPSNRGTKSSEAPENMFKVDKNCENLSTDKAKWFHNLVAKTLYTTKGARPDTCILVVFLTTIVREPENDEWKSLDNLMK